MSKRLIVFFVLLATVVAISGCGASLQQLYEGPRRPRDNEVVLIHRGNIGAGFRLTKIGSIKGTFGSDWDGAFELAIVPGECEVEYGFVSSGSGLIPGGSLEFEAQPGHTYEFTLEIEQEGDLSRRRLRVYDARTHRRVWPSSA
jgi:hypothetical protein